MRAKTCVLIGLTLFAAAPSADAVLKHYRVYTVNITEGPGQDPNPNNTLPLPPGAPPFDVAMIEETANPRLRKLQFRADTTTTINLPGLTQSIFLSSVSWEGPEAVALRHHHGVPEVAFTGTGSTGNGGSIRWGIVTGWTITGSTWCNSSPSVICSLALLADEQTADPRFNSEFYDLGTWIFHGTGFTSIPFVHSYFSSPGGNNQRWLRGGTSRVFSVPALPLLGLVVLGGSVAAGGMAAIRRRKRA